ncbi:MAG: MFS transporter, partial [Eubacterium sp.]|nr:MFS transporter [Eubacterium sp.]
MKKKKNDVLTPPANTLPADQRKNVTTFEYVCLAMARIGGMFGTTLTGTLAAAFLHELYYGSVGVSAERIAKIGAVQTTLTTLLGVVIGLVAGIIVQKWKTRWGRYRQW